MRQCKHSLWCARILVSVFFLTLLSATGIAADHGEKISHMTAKVFDATVIFPPPSWQGSSTDLSEHEIYRQKIENQFILEFIPKGEKFSSWSKLYAVLAIKSQNLSFRNFINASLGTFFEACGKENYRASLIEKLGSAVLLEILCTNSPKGLAKHGYGDGVGEVTIMWFGQLKDTKVKVYHHWRGDSFSKDDRATWPIGSEAYDKTVTEFKKIRLVNRGAVP